MSALASGVPCQDFVELVTPYAERTLPADRREAFEEHLLVCPACALYSAQIDQTTRLLARLRTAEDDAGDDDETPFAPQSRAAEGASTERERSLKFFASERIAPFSRTQWPEPRSADPWVASDAAALCLAGVHACTVETAPFWLNDELWIVELEGVLKRTERKLLAHRGRLVERVEAWNRQAHERFGATCVEATRTAVVELLEPEQAADARAFSERALDAGLAEEAARQSGDPTVESRVRAAWDYLAVALEFVSAPASVAFVAAVAVEHSRGPGGAVGERGRQAAWLRDKLALDEFISGPSTRKG